MKKWKKYLLVTSIIFSVLVLVMLLTNVYLVLLKPLDAGTEVNRDYGDLILVLGGGLKKGREIGYSTEERLILSAQLFNRKKRVILISGGSLYRGSPAIKKITDFMATMGVPKEFIKFEGKSQTTFDNIANTRAIIKQLNAKEVIVCTSPYHQERALMILRYLKVDNFRIAKMRYSEIYQANSFKQRMRNLKLIFREYMGILKFKILKK